MFKKLMTVAALAAGGVILSKQMKKTSTSGMGSAVEETITVDVPVNTAYNQWTQFEDFPKFMGGVREIKQLDDKHLHWRAEVAGKEEEWDAEITEQIPDQRIAWRSTSGRRNAGVATFQKLSDARTRITVQMEYEPAGVDEKVGDALGLMRAELKSNMKNFKELIESRGKETGAWRGTISESRPAT